MKEKIRCVILDDDEATISLIKDSCKDSQYVEIVASYTSPLEFLKEAYKIGFDLLLLNTCLPILDGFQVASTIKEKAMIFITNSDEVHLKKATEFAPIDLITKPLKKERLNLGLEKAFKLLKTNIYMPKAFALFSVAEKDGLVKIQVTEIIFAEVDGNDRRHKHIIMKDGKKYKLLYCTFEKLLVASPSLLRVNKSQLISLEAFLEIDEDLITLDLPDINGKQKQVTLSRIYRSEFKTRVNW